jgi:hypothetical protein
MRDTTPRLPPDPEDEALVEKIRQSLTAGEPLKVDDVTAGRVEVSRQGVVADNHAGSIKSLSRRLSLMGRHCTEITAEVEELRSAFKDMMEWFDHVNDRLEALETSSEVDAGLEISE